MSFKLPYQGFVFWPVGTGDSTTVCIDNKTIMQVDIHQLVCSASEDDPRTPIGERLAAQLPRVKGKPYLALFVLTHMDRDHCLGFKNLIDNVEIGEIWFSPRVLRCVDEKEEVCDDAAYFAAEAIRRVDLAISDGDDVASGDRVRIIGYDEILHEKEYRGFPKSLLTIPGHAISEIDGVDCEDRFRAFIHGPFKDYAEGERNDTSVAMQITLKDGDGVGSALLLGDHCYPSVKRMFKWSGAPDVAWNVFLAPHHCSKSVMYWPNEPGSEAELRLDVLDELEASAQSPAWIVGSCGLFPSVDKSGANPPHVNARRRYEEIAPFLCTQEQPNDDAPEAIVFEVTGDGLVYSAPTSTQSTRSGTLHQAVSAARGKSEPPIMRVGYGRLD